METAVVAAAAAAAASCTAWWHCTAPAADSSRLHTSMNHKAPTKRQALHFSRLAQLVFAGQCPIWVVAWSDTCPWRRSCVQSSVLAGRAALMQVAASPGWRRRTAEPRLWCCRWRMSLKARLCATSFGMQPRHFISYSVSCRSPLACPTCAAVRPVSLGWCRWAIAPGLAAVAAALSSLCTNASSATGTC